MGKLQRAALAHRESLPDLLRQVIALGGRTGSQDLIDWARRELEGYERDDELPKYRKATAPLQVDGATYNARIKGQTLAPFDLPDFARDDITNALELRMPIAQVEHLQRTVEAGDVVRLSPPGADDLVRYMNGTGRWTGHIERLYWAVSPVVLVGVMDGVRTALVSLTAQMKAVTPPTASVPSPEDTSQSVYVAIYGSRSTIKNLTISQAAEGSSVVAPDGSTARRWWQGPKGVLAGLAAVTSIVLALMQVQGWSF